MYLIIDKKGGLTNGVESAVNFQRFANYQDLETFKKKNPDTKLPNGQLFSWIVLKNGRVAKGSQFSYNFERFATEADLEKAKLSKDSEPKAFLVPEKENKPKK